MSSSTLLYSTGIAHVDALLESFIDLCEMTFPARICCYFLLGSYSDGSAVEDSDIDMGVLFKGDFQVGERDHFKQFLHDCNLLSPVRLDITPIAEASYTEATPGVKAAHVLYGENALADIPQIPLERTLPFTLFGAFHHPWLLRRQEPHLIYPLDYPDPEGEFYGYERWGSFYGGSDFGPGVRILVNSMTMIATALLGLKAQRQVGTKSQSVQDYKKYIGDEWTAYLINLYETCKTEWRYRIPETQEDRDYFRNLCERTLDYENAFFSLCRPTILANLNSNDRRTRHLALQSLQRVAYIGDDFIERLESLARSRDAEIRQAAKEVLQTITS